MKFHPDDIWERSLPELADLAAQHGSGWLLERLFHTRAYTGSPRRLLAKLVSRLGEKEADLLLVILAQNLEAFATSPAQPE